LLMMYSSAEYQYTSTGTLVTSASIADDEKQISDTVAKLATCREASIDIENYRSEIIYP
jgi:primosomal protein N''